MIYTVFVRTFSFLSELTISPQIFIFNFLAWRNLLFLQNNMFNIFNMIKVNFCNSNVMSSVFTASRHTGSKPTNCTGLYLTSKEVKKAIFRLLSRQWYCTSRQWYCTPSEKNRMDCKQCHLLHPGNSARTQGNLKTSHCSSIWSIAQTFSSKVRVIFVWPWNENARTKQKQQTNENRAIWLVYRSDTNALGFWLVRRTLGWKNFMPDN